MLENLDFARKYNYLTDNSQRMVVQKMAFRPLTDMAKVIGEEKVQELLDAFPGDRFYMKRDFISTEQRNKILLDDFYSGQYDRRDLAKKYCLSLGRIDQIIKEGYNKAQDIE